MRRHRGTETEDYNVREVPKKVLIVLIQRLQNHSLFLSLVPASLDSKACFSMRYSKIVWLMLNISYLCKIHNKPDHLGQDIWRYTDNRWIEDIVNKDG